MTIQHPEFAQEQQYVDHAYDLLDRGLAEAEQNIVNFEALHRSTAHAMNRALAILQNSRGSGQLVFGRMDRDDEKLYIGRRRVYDEDRNLVVVGWHAPAAAAFYDATPQEPGDPTLKRVFIEQDRRLQRIVDEVVRATARSIATSAGDATISDALLQELDRSPSAPNGPSKVRPPSGRGITALTELRDFHGACNVLSSHRDVLETARFRCCSVVRDQSRGIVMGRSAANCHVFGKAGFAELGQDRRLHRRSLRLGDAGAT